MLPDSSQPFLLHLIAPYRRSAPDIMQHTQLRTTCQYGLVAPYSMSVLSRRVGRYIAAYGMPVPGIA
eukprot:1095325-Rhodomonas_salina.3